MGLNLYSKVEAYLDFEEEVDALHREFLRFVMERDIDNILDIGCGQGYFLENLAINGKNYFGIDLSDEQIKVCKQKGLNAKCLPLCDVKEKFDCTTAIFDVINYIPKSQLKNFFDETNIVLNQGGFFIFDVNSLFGFEEVADGSLNINHGDKFIAIDAVYDDEKLNTNITFFSENKDGLYTKEEDCITQYYHDTQTLKAFLKEAGFEVLCVNEFNLHGFDKSDKLIFICKKI